MVSGASAKASNKIAPSISSGAAGSPPVAAACTAPAPKMRTGAAGGNTNNANSTPPPRAAKVNAAPMAPSKLSAGVPSDKLANNTGNAARGRCSISANNGATATNGAPHSSQCASVLASANSVGGCGLNKSCSSAPLWWSFANTRGNANSVANSAPTHTTAGATTANLAGDGPAPSANNAATRTKNKSGCKISPRRRQATLRSRRNNAAQAARAEGDGEVGRDDGGGDGEGVAGVAVAGEGDGEGVAEVAVAGEGDGEGVAEVAVAGEGDGDDVAEVAVAGEGDGEGVAEVAVAGEGDGDDVAEVTVDVIGDGVAEVTVTVASGRAESARAFMRNPPSPVGARRPLIHGGW